MKKIICLLFVALLPLVANTAFGEMFPTSSPTDPVAEWAQNEIHCQPHYVYKHDHDNYNRMYFIINYTQLKNDTHIWTGLYGLNKHTIYTKIPALKVFDCAYHNKITGTVPGISREDSLYVKGHFMSSYGLFKCFCRLNKELLDGCGARIIEEKIVEKKGLQGIAICEDGELEIK